MTDQESVIKRLEKVSYYFKSLLAVGWQGDADIYREHRESVNMAIAMLKEQPEVVRCKNCKNADILPWFDNVIICKKHNYTGVRPEEFYCADGKMKEGDKDD